MNHQNFVTAEEVSARQNNIKTLIRFAGSLSLLQKVMIPTVIVMFFAAAIPPYFLWFLGEITGCLGETSCAVSHQVGTWEVILPGTLSAMVVMVDRKSVV